MSVLRAATGAALFAALAACSGGDAAPSTTSSPATGVPSEPSLNGRMQIGDDTFEFAARCFLPGDGNITVTGAGFDDATGLPIDLLLRNIPARPYIGIRTAGQLIEADLDAPLTFVVEEGRVFAEEVTFVQNLDLLSGVGDPVGTGSVEVQCDTYVEGEPLAS